MTDPAIVARNLSSTATGSTTIQRRFVLHGLVVCNTSATAHYVKLYDKASAATEADTPVMTIYVAALTTVGIPLPASIPFTNGLSTRTTTAVADSSTSGAGANESVVNAIYY